MYVFIDFLATLSSSSYYIQIVQTQLVHGYYNFFRQSLIGFHGLDPFEFLPFYKVWNIEKCP